MLKAYLAAIKDVLIPKICFICEEKITKGYLCPKCFAQIKFINSLLCPGCGNPLRNSKEKCPRCARPKHPCEKLICVTRYKAPMVDLIHNFKYKSCDFLIELFGPLMIAHLSRIGFEPCGFDIVTAVPLHKSKLRDRGYNQSELLARYLAKYFNISFKNDIIYAVRENAPQAKLDRKIRAANIKGVFCVEEKLENKNVILVDDIFTTGSTIKECAYALKKQGAFVTAITLSKT